MDHGATINMDLLNIKPWFPINYNNPEPVQFVHDIGKVQNCEFLYHSSEHRKVVILCLWRYPLLLSHISMRDHKLQSCTFDQPIIFLVK